MKVRILFALLQKEMIRIKSNSLMPRIILMLPIMTMLVIPLVATLDVKHVDVAVVDCDHSSLSRRIIYDLDASEILTVSATSDSFEEALQSVERGKADVIVSIPANYEKSMATGSRKQIDIEANGVNATKGALGAQYAAGSISLSLKGYMNEIGIQLEQGEDPAVINRFNPTLDFRNFMIPALIVILLIIICGFLPTLNLVGEIESGTIEAMNVTPVGRFTFILSKLIPFWLIGILVVTVGMAIGRIVYGLSPQGSIAGFYLAAILFSLVMSGLGVMIANKSETMMQSIFVMFAIIMIFQLMSGLFTPISSMPGWARGITYGIPPRYFIEIMRALYLRGTSIAELWSQYLALGAFAILFSLCAALTYRKRN